ncbi:MAG: alginate export family protein [Proteobacteria bacterium]|nr:alginate export family protein [Pseudomonadota bacterium]
MKTMLLGAAALAAPLALAQPALAAPKTFGDPVKLSDTLVIDPMLDARLRWENVDTPTKDADAVTLRLRSGFELKHAPSHLSVLAEAEATLAIDENYNGLSFVPNKARPAFAGVADPANVELNRLQVQYRTKQLGLTVGRQRINLDDQRWVGGVAWRQNEQTFDAVRGEASIGPVMADVTYADSQRTIFGHDAGPRTAYDGHFWFLQAGVKQGPVTVKGFSYLLDYDTKEQVGPLAVTLADTQTYGVRATAALPLGKKVKLNLVGSYAHQQGWKNNPAKYGVDYVNLGYKANYVAVLSGMGVSIESIFPTDNSGTPLDELPLMQATKNYDDVAFIFEVADNATADYWVSIVNAQYGTPMGCGTTAVSAPKYYAFVTAGQFVGLLGGMKGAAEYELLVGHPAKAVTGMSAQSLVHLLIIFLVILGNVGYFVGRRSKRGSGN